jgi:hypothetical protein
VQKSFPYQDDRGFYQSNVITGAGIRHGESGEPWRSYNPTTKGRHWAISGKLISELPLEARNGTPQELLDRLDGLGLILHPSQAINLPRYKQYLDTATGIPYQDIWAYQPGTAGILYRSNDGIDEDVKWLDADNEREGYQNAKTTWIIE